MFVVFHAGTVERLELLRREHFLGGAHAQLLSIETKHGRRVLPYHMEIMGHQQNGQRFFLPESVEQGINRKPSARPPDGLLPFQCFF